MNNISWEFKKKKKVRKGEKTRCCWGSEWPGGEFMAVCSEWGRVDSLLMPSVLVACFWCWSCLCCSLPTAAAFYIPMRINEEAPARMTMTVSLNMHHQGGGASASPLCGTTAVRLGLREAAWCGREVIFSGGHERYCCACATPHFPPGGDSNVASAAPLPPYVQRGAALQMVKIEPTGDIFSSNNSAAVLKMIYRKSSLNSGFGSWSFLRLARIHSI